MQFHSAIVYTGSKSTLNLHMGVKSKKQQWFKDGNKNRDWIVRKL